jgi:hypothetical protein
MAMRMQALDGLDADHAFMLGLVRQHRRTRDVADGVDAGHVGLAVAVDHDAAAVGLDAELFQPRIFDVADHADRRDHPLELDRLRLALPSSMVATTLSAFFSSFVTLVFVRILMPCFSNACAQGRRSRHPRPGGSAAAPRPR